jgi:hypothetical protein
MAKDMDGNVIKVGDHVGYKDDVEKSGKVVRVTGEMVRLECWNSVTGEKFELSKPASRVWQE